MSDVATLHSLGAAILLVLGGCAAWFMQQRRRAGHRIGLPLIWLLATSTVVLVFVGSAWLRDLPWRLRAPSLIAAAEATGATGLAASIPPVLEALRVGAPVDPSAKSRLIADLASVPDGAAADDFRGACMAVLLCASGRLSSDDPLVAALWKAIRLEMTFSQRQAQLTVRSSAPWSSGLARTTGDPARPASYVLHLTVESITAADGSSVPFAADPADGVRFWISGCGLDASVCGAASWRAGTIAAQSAAPGSVAVCRVVLEKHNLLVGAMPASLEELVESTAAATLEATLRIPLRAAPSPAPRIAP